MFNTNPTCWAQEDGFHANIQYIPIVSVFLKQKKSSLTKYLNTKCNFWTMLSNNKTGQRSLVRADSNHANFTKSLC